MRALSDGPRRPRARLLCIVFVVALGLVCLAASVARAGPVSGITVLGDSVADEYQFPIFSPPGGDRSQVMNFVEILSATRGLNFGAFSETSRGSPRNEGFEFNWAEDGSTSSALIAKGQHTGAAQQAAQGDVNLAWMFIGANDFRELYSPVVIQGPDPGGAIQEKVVTLATNVNVAVQTLLAANPQPDVVVANLPDLRSLPALKQAMAVTQGWISGRPQ